MIDPHRPSYPLPPFTADQAVSEAQNPGARAWRESKNISASAEAFTEVRQAIDGLRNAWQGKPPHNMCTCPECLEWSYAQLATFKPDYRYFDGTVDMRAVEPPVQEMGDALDSAFQSQATVAQARYAAHRRAHAEATGRPYPDARHAVWPR